MIQKSRCLILLLILLCVGCYNKPTDFMPSFHYQCMEDFIDTRILFLEQSEGSNFIFDSIPFVPLLRVALRYKTARMQAQMTIRNGYNIKWTVFAEGRDRDIDWSTQAGLPIVGAPLGYTHINSHLESISTLVQRTIRNGFEQLKEAREEHEPWNIIIKEISDEGEIRISFGSSDGFKEGDILPIYSKKDLSHRNFEERDEQYCQNMQDNEYRFLAIARITEIKDNRSTLEAILQPQDGKSVQAGDIIKSVNKSSNYRDENNRRRRPKTLRGSRASTPRRRNNKKYLLRTKQSLRLGVIYADIDLDIRGMIYRHNIASFVRTYLFEEAKEFNFQISTGQYNNYDQHYNQ